MLRSRLLYALFERPQPVDVYGNGNGAWNVVRGTLGRGSTVLSVGVGQDISFDLAVNRKHGCRVILMDPSPTGVATIARHTPLPPGMTFSPAGLAGTDGPVAFAAPEHPAEGSFRPVSGKEAPPASTFPCARLKSVMESNGVRTLDLLKIDIEGFEYEVIDDLLSSGADVRQLCVEFHHGIVPGVTRMKTLKAIARLALGGFSLCNHEGLNHTFIRARD